MGLPSGMVTLLFTDIEDSIRLWEADREAMTEASARHSRMVREQIEAAGGHAVKPVGDAFRAVFADPVAALASALAVQRFADTEPWPPGLPIRVRMALHSGVCGQRDGDYFGPVVSRAVCLLTAGHGGQVLVSGATYELLVGRLPGGIGLRDLGEHRLKDLGRAERVFQVTGPGLAGRPGWVRCRCRRLTRHSPAVIAVLTAALALGGASAASAATHAATTKPVTCTSTSATATSSPKSSRPTSTLPMEPSSTKRASRFRRPTAHRGRSIPAGPGVLPRPPPAWPGPTSTGPR